MKKILGILLAIALVATLASCSTNDSSLIGNWALDLPGNTVNSLTITADTLTTKAGILSIEYGYSASKGTGKCWLTSLPNQKIDMSYTLSNKSNALSLTIAGVTLLYKRLE